MVLCMSQVCGTPLVWAACVAVLAIYLPLAPAMPMQEEGDTTWLPFLLSDPHAALNPPPARLDEVEEESDKNTRMKRVFLSRGWGPGGYDAPAPPPPQRYVRRPPLLPSHGEAATESPFALPLPLRERAGRGRFAALVSSQQQEAQQKPQYRRFHSIFTSGTWSPLGKRGAATLGGPHPFMDMQEDTNKGDSNMRLLISDKMKPFKMKDKRSRVFASQGWGAGGSPIHTWSSSSPTSNWTGTRHPWLADLTTTATAATDNSSGGGGDRYVASFRGPLLHHFLSHGWQPMGR